MFMPYHFDARKVPEGFRVLWQGLCHWRQERRHETERRQLAIRAKQMTGQPID